MQAAVADPHACAGLQSRQVQPFDDDLLAHLAGRDLEAFVAEAGEKLVGHDVQVAPGIAALAVAFDAVFGHEGRCLEREALEMRRRLLRALADRRIDDAADFSHRFPPVSISLEPL